MEYWDVYTLINDREPDSLISYVCNLIPGLDLDKEIGEYNLDIGSKELKMTTATEFIFSGCFHKNSVGGIRFNIKAKNNINGGWIYFNKDGSTVLGLTVKETKCPSALKTLKETCLSKHAYIAGDCPPAESALEFIDQCT